MSNKRAFSKSYMQREAVKMRRRKRYAETAEKWRMKQRMRAASPSGKAYAREYQRRRRRTNFNVHFMNWLRGAINRCLREQGQKRIGRTCKYIGCTPNELIVHLEAQFQPGMSWAIPRTWDVDHIIPSSLFDFSNEDEAFWAFNYRNLRPFDRQKNKIKSNKLPDQLPSWLPSDIAERIKSRAK